MPKNAQTGGQLIVESLRAHNIDTVFCVPGESYLPVMDALYDVSDEIRLIVCRHEGGASNMAEAYAKLSGKPGVCMVTRGPGACNASIGIHTAMHDATAMITLIGQVQRDEMGRGAFQEVEYRDMMKPLTKWVDQIEDPAKIPEMMSRAFQTASSGNQGPVALALPEDMLREPASVASVGPFQAIQAAPRRKDLERMRDMIAKAKRPLVLVGGSNWSDQAKEHFAAFVEVNNLPVTCAFRRMDVFDNEHPNFIGDLHIAPNPKVIEHVNESDLILAVGTRLSEITTQGYSLLSVPKMKQTLIHVHASAEELGRVYQPDLGIESGMENFAEALQDIEPVESSGWRAWMQAGRKDYESFQISPGYEGDFDLGDVMTYLRENMPDRSAVTIDAGNFSGWPHRYLRFGKEKKFIGGTVGAMGYAVPAAVAAQLHDPDRMAVAFVGDGGFGMTGNEIATAKMYGANPIVLIFNNRMLGTIRMHQEKHYPGRPIGTDLANPDFTAMSQALGAFAVRVSKTAEFAPAFEAAVESKQPAVIEMMTNPEQSTTRLTLSDIRNASLKAAASS
ncbi:MAG: thiamine pyrophosphate-binding protein [Rhodospirillaceae bacterium]|jgi:acetolactate synthase-1/2/3 large subunit